MKNLNIQQQDLWQMAFTPKPNLLIPTNGYVKSNGAAVMGAGVAKQVADVEPNIPRVLGQKIKMWGNELMFLMEGKQFFYYNFPTKHNWHEPASLDLIYSSATCLRSIILTDRSESLWILPMPGTGNGNLRREEVLATIAPVLSRLNNLIIVEK